VAICHEALRRAVPAGADVLSQGRLVVETSAAAKVCELDGFSGQEDILPNSYQSYLRFNVSVKNAVPVHVFDGLHELVNVVLHSGLRQVALAAFDGFVQIHFHDLEDERETACGLVVEDLDELNDVVVRR
jgi:hypothetical protein